MAARVRKSGSWPRSRHGDRQRDRRVRIARVELEMVLDFMPQVLAQALPGYRRGRAWSAGAEQAVILIGREAGQLLVDADGIPPVEQVAQFILQGSQAVGFLRHTTPVSLKPSGSQTVAGL